jgi:hypothetical protein
MKKTLIEVAALLTVVMLVFLKAGVVLAYQIETLPSTEVKNDIVLGPGKIEVDLAPGESATKMIYFTNRTGRTVNFTVNVEDFKGSRDPNQGTIFMGDQKGPYSLKDYLKPDTWTFTLDQGQRMDLPVTIDIPQDAEPGGKYGVVFATAQPPAIAEDGSAQGPSPVVSIASRVGTLFFVRVKGTAVQEGLLKSFSTENKARFFEQGPINFQYVFENNGNIHIDPYGVIEITNMMGRNVGEVKVSPFFAMPDSDRLNQVSWDHPWMFGRYTAKLSLNRGYNDIVDTMSYDFWVFPWKLALAALLAAFLLGWFVVWILGHFELKRK